jgi:hypothetical protein
VIVKGKAFDLNKPFRKTLLHLPEEEHGTSARGDGADVELRRLNGDSGGRGLEDVVERTGEPAHVSRSPAHVEPDDRLRVGALKT